VAQYALTWAANQASQLLRTRLFDHLLRAEPSLFTRYSASSLTNMLVYEIQGSVGQLVGSVLTLVRDSLTLVALLVYLLYLNWELTLFIAWTVLCTEKIRWKRLLATVALVASAWMLLLSGSRIAILAALGAAGAIWVVRIRRVPHPAMQS